MSLAAYPRIADWLGAKDSKLIVHTGKVDIGQRISTALAQIVHEELDIPLDRIDIAPVRTGAAPDEGITSGSNSVEQSGHAIRCAAASLRMLAISHVVDRFGGEPSDWILEDGCLSGPGANRPISLTDLIGELDLSVAVDADMPVSGARDAPARPAMRGLTDMVRGRFAFVHDLEAPGMLHARAVRPPNAKARLAGIETTGRDNLAQEGLHLVQDGSFLAIAGADEWAVTKAALRFATSCQWTTEAQLDEGDVFARLTTDGAQSYPLIDSTPHAMDVPPKPTDPTYSERFERPFTMHGSLAPSAAMAIYSDGLLTIHTHSQGIYPLRESIADSLGLPLDQVELVFAPGSGCYGHNGADDAAFEAALIALALPDTPILLKWTRAEEHGWEPYGPAMAVELAASLDDAGEIVSFSADAISGTHRGRPRPGPNRAGPAKLLANHLREEPVGPPPATPNMNRHGGMHRNLDPIYAFPEKRLVKNLIDDLPHRTSALRCLGGAANIFAIESFMDEIARRADRDPLDFRKAHLDDSRAVAVLERLQAIAGAKPANEGTTGRGVAYAQYKNAMTRVGVCVDLKVNDRAEIRLIQATIVADAGRVIDLDGLEAQLEGGFVQGASWALCEQVTWDRDGITSLDWDSYPVIRFDQLPNITVDILDRSNERSVGAGEAAPGPTLAAIANALFDATGIRMRRIPFTPEAILNHATADH